MSRKLCKLYIPRLMALLLCLLLLIPLIPAAQAAGGSCGSGLSWDLSAGTLTISGSGAMYDYEDETAVPWYSLRADIARLSLPSGLTHIGVNAFAGCRNLLTVTIPGSVSSIGGFAFNGCKGLEYLDLGSVQSIGEYAFAECLRLKALNLPGSVTSIGMMAFFRCESIPTVTIPAGVTALGNAAFSNCSSLVSAVIRASINVIPDFLFYECGRLAEVTLPEQVEVISDCAFRECETLNSVFYQGSGQSNQQISSGMSQNVPEFDNKGSVYNAAPSGYASSVTTDTNADGDEVQTNVAVTGSESVTVSANVETVKNNSSAEFNVNLQEGGSLEGVSMFVQSTLNEVGYDPESIGSTDSATINIYMEDSQELDSDFVKSMAEMGVDIHVTTRSGASWTIKASQLDSENLSGFYNLSYTLTAGSAELSEELGTETSYVLQFAQSAQVNSQVVIRLGKSMAYQSASLLMRKENGMSRIQNVMVDSNGNACFYLGSVDKENQYYIAMNLPAETIQDKPIIPDSMLQSYGENVVNIQPVRYEITGRTSSWNMGLGKVMTILAVVMVSVIVVVGFAMYFWNKQRLKNGYVPDWDDE